MMKRFFAAFLTVCMVISMAPAVFAADSVFTDVVEDSWFADEVAYVFSNGLMNGVGDNSFDPDGTVTRAMVWTTLARLNGQDTTNSDPWWLAGQQWAMENGISDGTMAEENITREQLVTMLYRYAQFIGMDISVGEDTNILSYTDAFSLSEWAVAAMQWACGEGIINGIDGALQPQGYATRAQLAAILYRFAEEVQSGAQQPADPVTPAAPAPIHTHNWGEWISDGNGGHQRVCSNNQNHIDTGSCVYEPVTDSVTNLVVSTCKICGYEEHWNGIADVSWYNEEQTEFILTTEEQLAGLADLVDGGNTFDGKTIKLDADLNLYLENANGDRVSFDPIGYGYDIVFKGTFDGQGHTISNLYQNGWELDYSYGTQGGGLFASVVDADFKNLTIDNAEVVMECVDMGILVGYSYGTCSYENITVSNSTIANYQRYTGGVVGEVNGTQTFKNVDVTDTTVSSLWGDFDCSLGGIIGGKYGEATLVFEDCDVACELNAYNDVTSSYQWYAYRRAGMLIGNSEETIAADGRTSASASYLTATNCTVTYGDWANYTYCEFAGTSWPYVRVQAGYSCDAYSNPRYGVATDANGNKAVDDTHAHNEGEDHNLLLRFDQLFGGGQGVYGCPAHTGVTVFRPVSDSTGLADALASGCYVTLSQDIQAEAATTAPYGNKYGFKMAGGVLDGNDHQLHIECYGDDYGIMTSGGTIKNLTIEEGCRAVMIMYPTEDIILDNVKIGGDGVLYPINTGEAGAEGVDLIVTNSTLKGWTSFSNIASASFTNCEFGQGTYYNNIYGRVLKPYVNTTITNCSFIEHMNLDLSGLAQGQKVTFDNCTVNGQPVTAAVFTVPSNDEQYDTELFTVDLPSWATSLADCMIIDGKIPVADDAELDKAIDNATGEVSISLGAGEYTLPSLASKDGVTIVGVEGTVIGGENAQTGFASNFGKNTTIQNVAFSGTTNGVRWSYANGGTTTFDNCSFAGDSTYGFHIDSSNGATFIFNGCTFSGFNAFAGDLEKVVFNNCTFLHNGSYGHTNIWSIAEFNGCVWGAGTSVGPRGDSAKLFFDGVEKTETQEF